MSRAASEWLKVTPFGIRKLLNWVKVEYGSGVPVYITENGFSDRIGNLDDLHREYYYKHYINQVLKGDLNTRCGHSSASAHTVCDLFQLPCLMA